MSATQTTATGAIKGIDITGFLVKDPQAQIAFYRDVLGIVPTEVDPEGRGAEFTLADGTTFGVWRLPEEVTGGFVMFAVDDLKAATARCEARGLKVSEPMETPVCFMAHGEDPEGNGIILHQRKA